MIYQMDGNGTLTRKGR